METEGIHTETGNELRSMNLSILVCAGFGFLWGMLAMIGLFGPENILPFILLSMWTIALLISSLNFRQAMHEIPRDPWPKEPERRRWFIVGINAIQIVAFFIEIQFCLWTNHTAFILPLLAMLICLYFLALVPIFQNTSFYLNAAVCGGIALVTVLFVPQNLFIGDHQVNGWMTVIGSLSALWLWSTAIWQLLKGYSTAQRWLMENSRFSEERE